MSIVWYVMAVACFLVAMGIGTAEDRNGWLLASGLYAIAGSMA